MEFTYNVGMWAVILLVVGSVVFGVVAQLVGTANFGYEWMLSALGAGIGAFVASEFIVGLRDVGPVFDGLALVPALIGGVIVGSVIAAATRYLTSGHHGAPQAI